ncbi:MAG: hypothetical protein Kow00127_24000 [Bacteroidales bacterium]
MNRNLFSIVLFVLSVIAQLHIYGQQYIDPEDNLQLTSHSWIILNPGTYQLHDEGEDGILQINNCDSIIIDGAGVTLDGLDDSGYAIKISNSSYVEIKNFESITNYYYAVYVTNSNHIYIHDNDFSWNKVDSSGWISIWTNYDQALGGGALFYLSQNLSVNNNTMQYQNDGVALYHCDSANVTNNLFSWNTSFGIRMYFTDNSLIQNNVAAHINRPYTNPSDCAAILLIVSNNNTVIDNDFTYSGDGIFLGQYQYSQIVNNNYFAGNDCSWSPHNAIEATFADGNVFVNNQCNYSHYGFWLGYSFNTIVEGNEISGNQAAGIAIDRGYNNLILNNLISSNPVGIDLWEGEGIPPYQNQSSEDYQILQNHVEGNLTGIRLSQTEYATVTENTFQYNREDLFLEGTITEDSVMWNTFIRPAGWFIRNESGQNLMAQNNNYSLNEEEDIECQISGPVDWIPFQPGLAPAWQTEMPADLAEPEAVWVAYPETCWGYGAPLPTIVEWDFTEKLFGEASVHISTGNGWDIGAMYRPPGDSIPAWNLSEQDTLVFWVKSSNNSPYGFQYCKVILGNRCGGYYEYSAPASVILNPTIGQWQEIRIVLSGTAPWARTAYGNPDLSQISFVEIHADTWDYGFELWIDGVHFGKLATNIKRSIFPAEPSITVFPNRMEGNLRIDGCENIPAPFLIQVKTLTGELLMTKHVNNRIENATPLSLPLPPLSRGIYIISFTGDKFSFSQKFYY